jgi:TPR repeat protein
VTEVDQEKYKVSRMNPKARCSASCRAALWLALASVVTTSAVEAQLSRPSAEKSSALDDPVVKRCLYFGLRRQNPQLSAAETTVDQAAAFLNTEVVLDGVATCRAAIAAFAGEPKVIIAHYTAAEALSLLLFGLKEFPVTDEQGIAKAVAVSAAEKKGFMAQLAGFYLGSAYEYGIGTKADMSEAMKWYDYAANAGDKISARELNRIRATKR